MRNQNFPQNHMHQNGNGNRYQQANYRYNQHQPMQPTHPVQPVQVILPQPEHPFSVYLKEVTAFCNHLNSKAIELLPKRLSIKQAIEIVMVADKLQVPRLDALRAWSTCSKGVIISAEFLERLFASRNMLSGSVCCATEGSSCSIALFTSRDKVSANATVNDYIDNRSWKADPEAAIKELALMLALRKAFPQLMMNIISPVEIPSTYFSKVKSAISSFYQASVTFVRSCFVTATSTDKKTGIETQEIPSTTRLISDSSEADDDFFLDLDEMEIKPQSKPKRYDTTPLN